MINEIANMFTLNMFRSWCEHSIRCLSQSVIVGVKVVKKRSIFGENSSCSDNLSGGQNLYNQVHGVSSVDDISKTLFFMCLIS